ncbi:MAG: FeoB-associated Cys-rich membrane protein [Lachnospiraceae bacterium]|nr:FeoB-associated Cys-rich membrane protein [Lachnospiraceae bacterium]
MNIWDFIIIFIVAALIVFSIFLTIRSRKKGSGCHHDCSQCGFCTLK